MSFTIAVAGKGGVGKTTFAGLIAKYLIESGKGPVFAVDADANSNLNEILGAKVEQTVGGVREDVMVNIDKIPAGVPKESFIEMKLQDAIIESKDFDLLVMGRPEGSGCYCYANNLLRKYIDMLSDNYKYIIVDNEAGMEHLSRRTTRNVDLLVIVSDASPVGVKTAERINKLVDELKLNVKRRCLVLSRVSAEVRPQLIDMINTSGLELAGVIPNDDKILELAYNNKPIMELSKDAPVSIAANEIIKKLVP